MSLLMAVTLSLMKAWNLTMYVPTGVVWSTASDRVFALTLAYVMKLGKALPFWRVGIK